MSLIYTRMSFVCHSYATRMSLVCHSYILVCHSYITRMYSYVIPMSLVCTRMLLVCVFTMNPILSVHMFFMRSLSCDKKEICDTTKKSYPSVSFFI